MRWNSLTPILWQKTWFISIFLATNLKRRKNRYLERGQITYKIIITIKIWAIPVFACYPKWIINTSNLGIGGHVSIRAAAPTLMCLWECRMQLLSNQELFEKFSASGISFSLQLRSLKRLDAFQARTSTVNPQYVFFLSFIYLWDSHLTCILLCILCNRCAADCTQKDESVKCHSAVHTAVWDIRLYKIE